MFRLYFSDRSIRALNRSLENAKKLSFDAVNETVLVTTLAGDKKAYLGQYFVVEGGYTLEELGSILGEYIVKRKKELTVVKRNPYKLLNLILRRPEEEMYMQSTQDNVVTLYGENDKTYKYPVTDEILNILEVLSEIYKKKQLSRVEPIHIVSAILNAESKIIKKIFFDLGISFEQAKENFNSSKIFNVDKIPYELSDFFVYLNEEVDTAKPCEILMRDKEIQQVWNISMKKNKHNTLLVGDPGVGKTALMQKMTYDIKTGNCPEAFKDYMILKLELNELMSDEDEAIEEIIKYLKKKDNVILFIDDVNSIISSGKMPKATMDFLDILKMIVNSGVIIVCAIAEEEYEALYACDESLFRMFERVILEEPLSNEVYPMIKSKVDALMKYHGVAINEEMVNYAIMIANCFEFYKVNPDKTLDLLDRSMVIAQRKDKAIVEQSDILESFEIKFELYNGMGEDARKEIAYHEAGHYIVGKASGRFVEANWLAISAMPTEGYLGITCPEERRDKIPFRNRQYYIDLIAFDLGGRVGEKVFRKEFTSGAKRDLYEAKELASEIVTKYGISLNEEDEDDIFLDIILNEKSSDKVNEEVKKLIQLAYKRAEEIIEKHKKLLEMIVAELLEKKIMSETELDVVWQKYLKEKEQKA